MNTTLSTTPLSNRDRAVLRAVAAGRSSVTAGTLVVDGRFLSDQFTGPRLAAAGLIDAGSEGPARLTATGASLLAAA